MRRGALPELSAQAARDAAWSTFVAEVYADSSRASILARLRTIEAILRQWSEVPLPPTVKKVLYIGASLKAGGYRSSAAYFSAYRQSCRRLGYSVGPEIEAAISDAVRSCMRGIGGSVRARALPFDDLHLLPGCRDPWIAGGPISPRNAISTGAWWLLREIELSTLRAALVEVRESSALVVYLHLPASKVDQQAIGVSRGHRCRCVSTPTPECPAHVVLDQLRLLQRQFPGRWTGQGPDRDLPLFPTLEGHTCTKAAMVDTLLVAARLLGVPAVAPDGSERISGHSLRVTGAQGLARRGVPLWSIQLLGRWGSDAFRGYLRDAAAHVFVASDSPVCSGPSLDALVAGAVELAAADSQSVLAAVESKIVERVGRVRAELEAALRDYIHRAVAELRPSAAGPAPAPPSSRATADWVRNEVSGYMHKVLVGPPAPQAVWTTYCGWRFGIRGHHTLIASDAVPQELAFIACWKCAPGFCPVGQGSASS